MNHGQQSGEAKHEDDAALTEFLASLMDYTPTIPDDLVEHYLAKSGFQCPDVRLIRLVAVATQKFVADVASDALQHCKARPAPVVKDKKQQKDKRLILTMEDLSKALREKIPITYFSKHIQGKNEHTTAKLRSEASDKTWEVEMDGRRLTEGWKDFAIAHDLRIGDIVIFEHQGDMVFNVTPFGPSFSEIQYANSHIKEEEEDIDDDDDEDKNENQQHNIRNVLRNKNLKSKREPESSLSHDYCFVANVTASNLKFDTLYIPKEAARSKALNKIFREIIAVNEEGNSWTLNLRFKESEGCYYIRGRWKRFCRENRQKEGDSIVFNLVGDGKSTPMICICSEEDCSELMNKERKTEKRRRWVASSSSRQNRLVTIILTEYNIKSSKLILPVEFTTTNGIKKEHKKIILVDKHGVKKVTRLVYDGPTYRRRGLGKGWKHFCEANGVFKIDPVLQSPTNPHFFKPILPGFDSHIEIPVTFFLKHLQGRNQHKTAKLRSDASDTVWEVKIDDGWRLTGGWKDFFIAHDFRVGDVIVYRHEGDLVFHVTSMGPNFCEIEYISSHNIDNDDSDNLQDNIASETKPMKKRAKKNPRIEEDSSSDHSCFVANVTVSNLYNDKLYLPISFARSNGWSQKYGKVVLLNEMGKSWKVSLDHDKTGVKTYLRHGWRNFCNTNGMNKGQYTFKLVQNSRTPVIRLCQASYKPVAKSSTEHSWFEGSLTPSSLRNDALYLPKEFVSSNGLKEGCEIVLKNESGDTRNLVLKYHKSNDVTVISPGWRSFCQTNGLKVRDFFRFKLVKTGAKHVLCLCAAETNSNTRLVECSEGTGVNSLSTDTSSGEESSETEESEEKKSVKNKGIIVKEESQEESIEDKSSSRECLNKEKWKYCSRPRASSSASQNRFVTLTITPNSVKSNKLRLPLQFTLVNGINKPGKITLLGQDGVTWMVCLVKDNINGRMSIGRDWKGFCEAHGVKIGKSFVLELIWGKDASPVLKFCTRSNSV